MNKGGKPMTTREMVMSLMAECMEDAARVVAPYLPTHIAPQTLAVVAGEMAAEMFRARWAMMCHVGTEEPG